MGLKIRLKPHERIVINGCVVTNGDRRNTITVSSFGQILRSKDVLQLEEAKTPYQRLYYAVQMLLINGPAGDADIEITNKIAAIAFKAANSDDARGCVLSAMEHAHQGNYYKALAELRPLILETRDQRAALEDANSNGAVLEESPSHAIH